MGFRVYKRVRPFFVHLTDVCGVDESILWFLVIEAVGERQSTREEVSAVVKGRARA